MIGKPKSRAIAAKKKDPIVQALEEDQRKKRRSLTVILPQKKEGREKNAPLSTPPPDENRRRPSRGKGKKAKEGRKGETKGRTGCQLTHTGWGENMQVEKCTLRKIYGTTDTEAGGRITALRKS